MRKLDLSSLKEVLLGCLDVYGLTKHYERAEMIFSFYDDDLLSYDELREDLQLTAMVVISELCYDMRIQYMRDASGSMERALDFARKIKLVSVLL